MQMQILNNYDRYMLWMFPDKFQKMNACESWGYIQNIAFKSMPEIYLYENLFHLYE